MDYNSKSVIESETMVHHSNHPLLQSLVNTLRDNRLGSLPFRHGIEQITKLLAYEALRDAELQPKTITTWQGEQAFSFLNESSIMVVSVLRAALPMHLSLIDVIPEAVSGFLGMKRDEETHESVLYYDRVGDCSGKTVIIVDPMVATGGSLCDAIEVVKQKGAVRIITLNILASPEGVTCVLEAHPDITMVVAAIDKKLSDDKFILPGLGDAGDRAFNTL